MPIGGIVQESGSARSDRSVRGYAHGMTSRFIVILSLLVLAHSPLATGQDGQPQDQPKPRTLDLREAPPTFRLGIRVLTHRSTRSASPVLVIATNAGSYVEAISRWTADTMFPVLIDDGSQRAAEDIARFARAFKPERIVRFDAGKPLPAGHAQRITTIETALGSIWGIADDDDLMGRLTSHWQFAVHAPPGVVVADPNDPAWTGALALAAGHAQPIIWFPRHTIPEGIDNQLGETGTANLIEFIETELEASGMTWQGLGDTIDAVTICMNIPIKCNLPSIRQRDSERFALTDIIGKHRALTSPRGSRLQRWAWAGQMFGSESTAAYRAMSGLFLQPTNAWVFDGYPDSQPWNAFDGAGVVTNLAKANMPATLFDTPRQGLSTWQSATTRPIDADVVFVTTKGMPEYFDLEPGRAHAQDVPVLDRPAAVSFVHSWSAARPGDTNTIAGAWLDRGAHLYVGSVHEPYLQAFIPSPILALRLMGGLPWGAAIRPDGLSPIWKVALIGDPLLAIGTERSRSELLEIEGALPIAPDVAEALKAKDYAKAARAMVLLGRDSGVARLADAVRRESPVAFDAQLAEIAAMPAFRVYNKDLMIACVLKLDTDILRSSGIGDALWHILESDLRTGVSSGAAAALERSLRGSRTVRDAIRLAGAVEATQGIAARNALLDRIASTVKNKTNARKILAAKR